MTLLLVALALVFGACDTGADDDEAEPLAEETAAPSPEFAVQISQPREGDELETPFVIRMQTTANIGTGDYFFHIWYDDDEDKHQVVTEEQFAVAHLEPGEHTIHVSLRNPDGSPAGSEDQVTVTISG